MLVATKSSSRVSGRACERSWAARISAPRLSGCSLLCTTAQSYTRRSPQRPLCAYRKFHSARLLKFKRGSNSWRCTYMTCLLALRNILQTPSLNEWPLMEANPWRHTWVWTCACVQSGIGTELERNGTIALSFGLKPALRSDYISHAPPTARSALRSHALVSGNKTHCIKLGDITGSF